MPNTDTTSNGHPKTLEQGNKVETKFVALDGDWEFKEKTARYNGPAVKYKGNSVNSGELGEDGVCLATTQFQSGQLEVRATIEDTSSAARLVFGFNAATASYYSLGLNGWNQAYVLARHTRTSSVFLKAEGPSSVLTRGVKLIQARITGQRVSLSIDSVAVLEHLLQAPVGGSQVGLYAWGKAAVQFEKLTINADPRKAFVVMQFGDQYDVLWNDVIRPVAKNAHFDAVRGDNIYGSGVILQDIVRQIVESDVIIAEITPSNPNAFYELGYAHAVGKPAILLANRDDMDRLPFDISGYRVVYYSDTIGGESDVETELSKHLEAVRLGPDSRA